MRLIWIALCLLAAPCAASSSSEGDFVGLYQSYLSYEDSEGDSTAGVQIRRGEEITPYFSLQMDVFLGASSDRLADVLMSVSAKPTLPMGDSKLYGLLGRAGMIVSPNGGREVIIGNSYGIGFESEVQRNKYLGIEIVEYAPADDYTVWGMSFGLRWRY